MPLLGRDDVTQGVNNNDIRSVTRTTEAATIEYQPFSEFVLHSVQTGYRDTLEIETFDAEAWWATLASQGTLTVDGDTWIVSSVQRASPLDGAVVYRVTLKRSF